MPAGLIPIQSRTGPCGRQLPAPWFRCLAVSVDEHEGTAAGLVGAELDREASTGHISLSEPGQCQRSDRFAGGGCVQGQAGEAASPLTVNEVEGEVLRRDAPDRGRIAAVEAHDRTPNVGGRAAVVDEERVRPTAAGEKIGASPT